MLLAELAAIRRQSCLTTALFGHVPGGVVVAAEWTIAKIKLSMAEFLEDPSVLTKDKLKNELAVNNVPLPSGEHKKEVYVQLYLKNLTILNNKKSPPADTFSSDEELPAPVVSNKSRSGRVSFINNCWCITVVCGWSRLYW